MSTWEIRRRGKEKRLRRTSGSRASGNFTMKKGVVKFWCFEVENPKIAKQVQW